MKVQEWMTRDVASCLADESLNRVAQLMWDGDFGVVPVVGVDGIVVGMITDRDVCMAVYTRGRTLGEIRVEAAMAKQVATCSPDSTVETALALMRESRVRRLPIVDHHGKLVGILSLNDLACASQRLGGSAEGERMRAEVGATLAALCKPRFRPRSEARAEPRTEARSERKSGVHDLEGTEVARTLAAVSQPWCDLQPAEPVRHRVGSLAARQSDTEC
jgi:CBS domain-containing protein